MEGIFGDEVQRYLSHRDTHRLATQFQHICHKHQQNSWQGGKDGEGALLTAEGNTWLLLTTLEQDRRAILERREEESNSMALETQSEGQIYRTPGEIRSQLLQRDPELRQNQMDSPIWFQSLIRMVPPDRTSDYTQKTRSTKTDSSDRSGTSFGAETTKKHKRFAERVLSFGELALSWGANPFIIPF